jgi:SAM-dependent methyltransferase
MSMRARKNFKEIIMKNVISLVLAFGIFFAGCAEKQADPVIVSLTNQENPAPVLENPVKPVTIEELKPEEVKNDVVSSEETTEQADEYREPDVIFVPTPQDVVDRMLELAQVTKDDLLYDLGCGDGRIVVTAAKRYGCKAVGYDIDPERVKESLENVQKNKVGHLVKIEHKDIFALDLEQANVITLYLLPSLNVKLIPQLDKLKPGSRIVSHDFRMRGVKPDKVIELHSNYDDEEHKIYLWTTPLTIMVKKNPDSSEDNSEQ